MAGSRLHKIGNIFTRTTGLLKSGTLKEYERPLWYDVYEAFPPKDEPRFDRPVTDVPIKKIFYPEDTIRALFYEKFENPGVISLNDINKKANPSEKFIEVFKKLESSQVYDDETKLINAVEEILVEEGIILDWRKRREHKQEMRKTLKLSELFKLGLQDLKSEELENQRPEDFFALNKSTEMK